MVGLASPELQHPPTNQSLAAASPLDIRHLVIVEPGHTPGDGVHTVAKALAREQALHGDSVRIAYLSGIEDREQIELSGITSVILPLGTFRLFRHYVILEREVGEAIIAGATSRTILHLHGGRFPLWISVARLLRRHNLPYILTVHGRYAHAFDLRQHVVRYKTALYLKLLERGLLESAQGVHAVSEIERKCLLRLAPRAKVSLVPNGGFSSALEGVPPLPLRQVSSGFPRFGFCGRLAIYHKGLDLLLKGFALYRAAGGSGTLTIAGPGPTANTLAQMAADLGLSDICEIRGPVFGHDKTFLFRSLDYFVMTSRFEGGATAPIEAAVHGTPLIMSEQAGMKGDLSAFNSGMTIQALEPSKICERFLMAEAISPRYWRRMSRGAHEMALALGDWSKNALRLRELYKRR